MASKKLFIDSSVLYAFIDRADSNHTQAVKIIEQLSIQGFFLFTSLQVIQDTYTTINNQLGQTLSFEFIQVVTESNIEILCPQKSDLVAAFKLVKLNRDKRIPLKEAIIAVVMQRRDITQILTFGYWHNLLGSFSYLQR